jgi:hypothetical protein
VRAWNANATAKAATSRDEADHEPMAELAEVVDELRRVP